MGQRAPFAGRSRSSTTCSSASTASNRAASLIRKYPKLLVSGNFSSDSSEQFPETNNFGYFLIKLAALLLAVLALLQVVLDLLRPAKGAR